ncbi:MAG: hypothetical protein ABWZ56_04265 [Flavobacterium sp.]
MELHLKIIGWILILLASVHVVFPRRFNWKEELSSLSLINREVMYVHTFFIALVVLLMGILCLTSAKELIETNLGNKITLGLGAFWLIRLLIQFFGYSPELWKGKKFETIIHILFSFLWIYLSVIFLMIYCKYSN